MSSNCGYLLETSMSHGSRTLAITAKGRRDVVVSQSGTGVARLFMGKRIETLPGANDLPRFVVIQFGCIVADS